jgi:hypothetical protein
MCVCDYRRGMDSWIDLLIIYMWELQRTITLLLISTPYKSLHSKSSSAYIVFTSRYSVTTLNSGDPSASVLTLLLSDEYSTI